MGDKQLLTQDSSGLLLHGELGEKLVNRYEFYAAFTSDDEFRLLCEGKILGSLPVSHPLLPDQRVIFAGHRWRVLDVDSENKVVMVTPDRGGAPPAFDGGGAVVHDVVRQEMRAVLAESTPVPFLDQGAAALLAEARDYYRRTNLRTSQVFQWGHEAVLVTWRGDAVNDGLVMLLATMGLRANNEGVALAVPGVPTDRLLGAVARVGEMTDLDPVHILAEAKNILREKWDWAMPDELLRKSFASQNLELNEARRFAAGLSHPR
jgi:ATP-dependent Lhr-like helicase